MKVSEETGKGRFRFLLVDDSSTDLDLMEREILEWGLNFECVKARGRVEFLEALGGPRPDLVITDYVLPDLGGLDVLRLVRERHPFVPVIVVTGAVDERTVSECIGAGAADYVLKDHLLRLPIAALRALEDARTRFELLRSEEKYRLLVEHLPVVAFSLALEPSIRLAFVSRRVEQVLGHAPARWMEGRWFLWRRIHPHDRRSVLGGLRKARLNGGFSDLTFRILDEERVQWVRVQASSMVPDGGGGLVLQGVLRDITEQKEAELERDLLSAAVEQSNSLVVITDLEGNALYANRAFETLTGFTRDEILGRNPRILMGDEDRGEKDAAMWETLRRGKGWDEESVFRSKDGTPFLSRAVLSPIHDHQGHITHIVSISKDVTAEREMEAQLRQMQRTETVGQLTGGIAHDMNNILTAVMNFTAMARADLEPSQISVREDLEQVEAAGERGAELIGKLMAFSRREHLRFEVLDAEDVVQGLRGLLTSVLPESIRITTDASGPGTRCRADQGALEQILMNLATNARDAMPDGGALRIDVGRVPITSAPEGASHPPEPGPYVRIRVRDTGAGMEEAVKQRLFEPFFTTKPKGKGTGLGLAVVAGLVEQHRGFVTAESTPGLGTTMSVYLPALPAVEEPLEGVDGTETGIKRLLLGPAPRGPMSYTRVDDLTSQTPR